MNHQQFTPQANGPDSSEEKKIELDFMQSELRMFSRLNAQIAQRRQMLDAFTNSAEDIADDEHALIAEIRRHDDAALDQMFHECARIDMRQRALRAAS